MRAAKCTDCRAIVAEGRYRSCDVCERVECHDHATGGDWPNGVCGECEVTGECGHTVTLPGPMGAPTGRVWCPTCCGSVEVVA